MDREQLAIKFREEYEKLCDKYGMEIAMFDKWDDECYSLAIYDREEKVFIID